LNDMIQKAVIRGAPVLGNFCQLLLHQTARRRLTMVDVVAHFQEIASGNVSATSPGFLFYSASTPGLLSPVGNVFQIPPRPFFPQPKTAEANSAVLPSEMERPNCLDASMQVHTSPAKRSNSDVQAHAIGSGTSQPRCKAANVVHNAMLVGRPSWAPGNVWQPQQIRLDTGSFSDVDGTNSAEANRVRQSPSACHGATPTMVSQNGQPQLGAVVSRLCASRGPRVIPMAATPTPSTSSDQASTMVSTSASTASVQNLSNSPGALSNDGSLIQSPKRLEGGSKPATTGTPGVGPLPTTTMGLIGPRGTPPRGGIPQPASVPVTGMLVPMVPLTMGSRITYIARSNGVPYPGIINGRLSSGRSGWSVSLDVGESKEVDDCEVWRLAPLPLQPMVGGMATC